MGTNRKLPFGYEMVFGEVCVSKEESNAVNDIFQQYCIGVSFLELAEYMKSSGIQYDNNKTWNKNMIARILQDQRYLGDGDFPRILSKDLFYQAAEIRERKATAIYPSMTNRLLRSLSGTVVTEEKEKQVLWCLNKLIENPSFAASSGVFFLEQASWNRLEQLDPNKQEEYISEVFQIAAVQYQKIPICKYETAKIQHLLNRKPIQKLEPEFIKAVVQKLSWDPKGEIYITLKNGQTIGGSTWKKEG